MRLLRQLPSFSEWQWLGLLFILALVVRIIGIDYGYWHGDERINEAAKVLTGQLIPGQHFYPPLLNYINAVCLAVLFVLGRMVPAWYNVADFRALYFSDPTVFYLTCRLVTAAMGAALAPLFYLVAKQLHFKRSSCLLAGLFGVFIPVVILLSHFAKSDVGLAMAAVLVFWFMLRKFVAPQRIGIDIAFGFFIALAMSFKHSYLFIFLPLIVGYAILLWRTYDFTVAFKSLLISGVASLLTWIPMNIGIVLDFQNFLDFQKIQAQMSVREGEPFSEALAAWFYWAAHGSYGVNVIITLAFMVFPFYLNSRFSQLVYKAQLNVIWMALALPSLVVIAISGARQHSGLWVPYFVGMQLLAALMFIDALRSRVSIFKWSAVSVSILALGLSVMGSVEIWRQSLAPSNASLVANTIKTQFSDRKIVSSFLITLPKTLAAYNEEQARHERLAKKYNIELPEQAAERFRDTEEPGAVHHQGMPGVMFGLEETDDESLGDAIKPYTWPLQKEEWQLDFWLNKNVSVFVISDLDYYSKEIKVQTFRDFYQDMLSRCEVVVIFLPVKSLFLEAKVSVVDCAKAMSELLSF